MKLPVRSSRSLSSAAKATAAEASSQSANFRIVSINDVYDLANLPRLQTFLTKLPPNKKPQAVVLAGDFLSPSTLSSIDGGRGMVATLRTIGVTHVSLGNHEQDLKLDTLHQRVTELSKSIAVLNSNVLPIEDDDSSSTTNNTQTNWIRSLTHTYSLVPSACGRVTIALLGLLSDEPGIFRDNTFKSIPIGNVLDTYTNLYETLVGSSQEKRLADFCLPLTHQSMARDKELAHHMLEVNESLGLILGGHEHEPYNEIVTGNDGDNSSSFVQILKSGMDAQHASVVDITFELDGDVHESSSILSSSSLMNTTSELLPRLVKIEADLVDLSAYDPSPVAQQVVDKHMSVISALEHEIIVDADHATNTTVMRLPPGVELSSKRTRFQQTTVGGIFCQVR